MATTLLFQAGTIWSFLFGGLNLSEVCLAVFFLVLAIVIIAIFTSYNSASIPTTATTTTSTSTIEHPSPPPINQANED